MRFGCRGESDAEEFRTCPQYFFRMPIVQFVYSELVDYKRGALGNVRHLPAPLLDCLRIAEAEQHAVKDYFEYRAMADAQRDEGPKR